MHVHAGQTWKPHSTILIIPAISMPQLWTLFCNMACRFTLKASFMRKIWTLMGVTSTLVTTSRRRSMMLWYIRIGIWWGHFLIDLNWRFGWEFDLLHRFISSAAAIQYLTQLTPVPIMLCHPFIPKLYIFQTIHNNDLGQSVSSCLAGY